MYICLNYPKQLLQVKSFNESFYIKSFEKSDKNKFYLKTLCPKYLFKVLSQNKLEFMSCLRLPYKKMLFQVNYL